jgi:CRISPR-associated endonuclease/helicase Cas3
MSEQMTFEDLVRKATGKVGMKPYPYQMRLADEGLPELLAVPTGTGKTMAAVLPWLYRRRFHADQAVRQATPRRLVFVLPMRVLVEQTASVVRGWLTGLGLEELVDCEVLMGGEPRVAAWRKHPERDAVIIGTLDMVLSRSLNRGFGESRFVWPIDFGLFNNDCHFVYDEVQLMGPALATSRQLHGLREVLGTAAQCTSTWMSATVPEHQLLTFDAPELRSRVELKPEDISGGLATRLAAHKRVLELPISDDKRFEREVSQVVADHHTAGTLTIVVLNTVERARSVFKALEAKELDAQLVLLHSRFRPGDRKTQADLALADVTTVTGRIVVSTQVIEAGVDVSASLLVTEAAPWPSIVQRAGRCNRDGQQPDAQLVWFAPASHEPYEKDDVLASTEALRQLDGALVTSQTLRDCVVAVTEEIHPVLRRKDLIELFDTLPDLTGNDIDVSRFIRKSDELDLSLVWRSLDEEGLWAAETTSPGRDERCPVSVGAFKKVLKAGGFKAWRYDHLAARWVLCASGEVRPGMVVLLDSATGRYTPATGWDPDSKVAVDAVAGAEPATDDESTGDDPASADGSWLSLKQHLADTEREIRKLLDGTANEGLTDAQRMAAVQAARLHDIGKAHPHFQQALKGTAASAAEQAAIPDAVLAKGGSGRLRHKPDRPNFRHELVSALALLGEGSVALSSVVETDLAVYLVAAHHGRIRMGIRAMSDDAVGNVLGVHTGDQLPAVEMLEGEIPMSTMDLSIMELGERNGRASWSARALALRDRPDLGPFRLGFLEAMVRLADWAASAQPTIASGVDHG